MSDPSFQTASYRAKSLVAMGRGRLASPISAPTKEPAFWEKAMYVMGKPEEWLVKGIAAPFTDDPAMQFGSGKNIYDQANFSGLLRSAGAGEVAALGLGLTASVILDPLNLIGVGALTKAGKVGQIAKAAKGMGALETLEDGTQLFSKSKMADKIAELSEVGTKRSKKAVKNLNKQLSSMDALNSEFVKLQKAGHTVDDIMLADTFTGRLAKKQQSVLSLGLGNNIMARPFSRAPALAETVDFGIKGRGPARLMEYPFKAGRGIKEAASKGLNKLGAHIPVTHAEKQLKETMTRMMMNLAGDVKDLENEVLNMQAQAAKEGITTEDFMDIINAIEGPDAILKRKVNEIVGTSAFDDLAKLQPTTPHDVEKIIRRPIDELFNEKSLNEALNASKQKHGNERLVYLTPDEFLKLAYPLDETPHLVMGAEEDLYGESITKIDRLRKAAKDGDKLEDIPFLRFKSDGHILGHEGRHRALLAKELGYEHIPVRMLRSHQKTWADPKTLPSKLRPQDAYNTFIDAPYDKAGNPKIPHRITKVERTKGSFGVENSKDLTHRQQALVNPSLVSEDEAIDAVNNAAKAGFGADTTGSGHGIYTDKHNVVIKLNKDINKKLLTQNLDIPGVTPWKIVDTEDGRHLVGNWGGGTISHNKEKWTREHLNNLERTAAMLAQKGMRLGTFTPADVLVGSAGEIQIINPEIISKVVKPRNKGISRSMVAAEGSKRSIEDFVNNVGDLPRSNLDTLSDAKLTKQVTKEDFTFSTNAPDAERLVGSEQIYHMKTSDLISQGNNTQWLKTLDEDAIKGSGIDKEVQKLQETGTGRPIQVTVDDRGNLEIKEGSNRLAAALLAGYDEVPVERVPYTGEIAANLADERVITGPTRNATQIIEDLPQSTRLLPGNLDDFTVQDVRFLGPKGVVRVGGSAVDSLSESTFLSDFGRWFTREDAVRDLGISTARADNLVTTQQSVLASGMARAVGGAGHEREATLLFADILNQTDSPEGFFRLLRERAGVDLTYVGRSRKDRALLNREFAELKRKASTFLGDLGEDGLFVSSTRTPEHIGSATRKSGLTAVYVEGDDMRIINHSQSQGELMPFAKAHLQENAADLAYDANVVIDALDGSQVIKGVDIVGDAHPWSERVLPANSRFFIEQADKERLAEQGVSLWNDPKMGEILGADAGKIIENRGQTFFVSRSGALVVGRQQNVEGLLHLVFGEGTKHAQEIGAITGDTIYLSNVFGSSFPTFSIADTRDFVKRLRSIASKFDEAGFDHQFRMSVELPFDDEIAKNMLKKDMTLGDVLNDRDIFSIPPGLENLPARPVNLPNVVVHVGEKLDRITSPAVRKLGKWVLEKFDEMALKELEAGLPLTYNTTYFARFLSTELQSKVSDLMINFMGKKGMMNWYNKNFQQRRFTDLRTEEVNQFFNGMQDEFKLSGEDFIKFGNEVDSPFMRQLAAEAPEAAEFFITDPFRVIMARGQTSLKSINAKLANEAIADPANGMVIASVTKGEMGTIENYAKDAARIKRQLSDLKKEISLAEGRKAAATPDELTKIQKNIDSLTAEQTKASAKYLEMAADPPSNPGWSAGDIQASVDSGSRSIVMSSDEARDLVRQGLMGEEAIQSSTGGPMVKVQLSAVPDGAKLHIMDPEVAKNLVTRFGMAYTDPKPIVEMYDKVLNIWKNWTLFPIPKYHARNFASNIMLGWLGEVEVASYKHGMEINSAIRKYTTGGMTKGQLVDTMKSMQFTNDAGQTIDGHALYSAWIHEGGITGGLHVNELGMNNVVTRKSISLGFSPATELVSGGLLLDNAVIRTGRNLAEANENFFRFGAFIDGWTKTGSFQEAGLNMKKLFYNYNDLNAFEKNVLRRVIPFYSWSRHNIPRMLETMFTQPILHYRLAQFVRNVEQGAGGPTRPEELPEWLADRFHINVGKNSKGQLQIFVADGVVPMVDAYRAITSLQGGFDMLKEGVTPFLKVPFEQVFNMSMFTGREIERAPGEPARSYTLASMGFTRRATAEGKLGLSNLLFNESLVKNMRVFSLAAQFMDDFIYGEGNIRNEDPTAAAMVLDMVLGRVYSVDTERAVRWDNMRHSKEVARAKAFIKEGTDKNRQALIDFGRARLTQLEVIKE